MSVDPAVVFEAGRHARRRRRWRLQSKRLDAGVCAPETQEGLDPAPPPEGILSGEAKARVRLLSLMLPTANRELLL